MSIRINLTQRQFSTRLAKAFAVLVVALAGVVFATMGWGQADASQCDPESVASSEEVRPLPVEAERIDRLDSYTVNRRFTGVVAPRLESELAFELPGLVEAVLVEEGERVAKGDVLARLDRERPRADLRRAEAELAAAKATLDELVAGARREDRDAAAAELKRAEALVRLAEPRLKRTETLRGTGSSSEEEYDEAKSSLDARRAEAAAARAAFEEIDNGTRPEKIAAQQATVDRLKAAVDLIEVDLRKSELVAPYDGVVAGRDVDPGSVVSSGQRVVTLYAAEPWEARVGVPRRFVDRLEKGLPVRLVAAEDGAPNEVLAGYVRRVLPQVDESTRTVMVLLDLTTASGSLGVRPGSIIRLRLDEEVEEQGFRLPLTSLTENLRGLWSAYSLAPAERAGLFRVERRDVNVLAIEGERAFVRGTLSPGDLVVVDGSHRLAPGQLVTLADESTTTD